MSFGIGLGGFMDGFQKGAKVRAGMDENKRNKVLQGRQDAEYDRALKQRDEIDAVNTDTRQQFDSLVQTGEKKPEQFDQFWNEYAMPKLKQTYLAQGDMENAKKVAEWGETEAAKTGGRLFSSAMLKAQTGDSAGALDDIIKAGQVKGYIEHGYELDGRDDLVGPDGKVMGYRLRVKTANGEVLEQDIKMDDLPKMIATFANPEAAWQSHLAAQAESKKDEKELKTYAAKKEIDKAYGVGGAKGRGDAITSLRKRMEDNSLEDKPTFDDLPADEKERLIAEEMQLQSGQPGLGGAAPEQGPQRKVIVDDVTGEAVPADQAKGKVLQKETERAVAEEKARPRSRAESAAYTVANAAERVKLGDDPAQIAQELLNNGIPQESWPPELQQALQKKKSTVAAAPVIGLGG